jgi:hypothetical protein
MASDLPEFDEQDQAEVFDEDVMLDPGVGPSGDMRTLEELPDVYDVTRALGDSDVDEVHGAQDADEINEEELEALGDDLAYDDEAEDDTIDDELEDEPEDTVLYGDDEDDADLADGVTAAAGDEASLEYVDDLDETRSNAGRAARHLESRGELSNEDLEELGYREGKDGNP